MAPGRQGTRSIRVAATELRKALTLPEAERALRVRDAREWLLSAADEQGLEATQAREKYFTAPASAADKTISAVEALTAILDQAQTAQTLIAAGHAINETGAGGDAAALDNAIVALESGPDFATVLALHFSVEPTRSPDLPTAMQTLRSRTDESMKTLVSEAHHAGSKVVEKLIRIDSTKALEALANLGGPFEKLPDLGILIRKGIEKLQSAIDSLKWLLDEEALKQVKEKITALWKHVQDGTLLDSLLAWTFEDRKIQATLQEIAEKQTPASGRVDGASDLLPALGEGFKNQMKWASTLNTVVAASSGLLLIAGVVAAGPLAAFTVGAYLLILAAIVIIGRDYAGRKGHFHDGNGILGVIESVTA